MKKTYLDLKSPWTVTYGWDRDASRFFFRTACDAYNEGRKLADQIRNNTVGLAWTLIEDFAQKLKAQKAKIEFNVGKWHITRSFMAGKLTPAPFGDRNTYHLLPKIEAFGLIKAKRQSLYDFGKGHHNCLELSINLDFIKYQERYKPLVTEAPKPAEPVHLTDEQLEAEATNYFSTIFRTKNEKARSGKTMDIGKILKNMVSGPPDETR